MKLSLTCAKLNSVEPVRTLYDQSLVRTLLEDKVPSFRGDIGQPLFESIDTCSLVHGLWEEMGEEVATARCECRIGQDEMV